LSGAFWPDSGSAGQFVRRITAERNESRHLVWIDAVSLLRCGVAALDRAWSATVLDLDEFLLISPRG
jgi:hypothetical protein